MNFTILPIASGQGSGFPQMWCSQYSRARNQQWMATAKAYGFNAIRYGAVGTPVAAGEAWLSAAAFRPRFNEFATDARALGLKLVTQFGGGVDFFGSDGSLGPTNIPYALAYWQVQVSLAKDLLVYNDCVQEYNYGPAGPSTWVNNLGQAQSDLAAFYKQMLAIAPDIPITSSVLTTDYSNSNGALDVIFNLNAMGLAAPFYDVHYYGGAGNPPTAAIMNTLETRTKSLPYWIIGESGLAQSATAAQRTSFLQGVGAVALRPKSAGVALWCITPQDTVGGSNDWGFCSDTGGTQVRSEMAAGVAAWPALP